MKTNEIYFLKQVEKRICELQKAYLSLQEQFKASQSKNERNLDDSALKIIDALDMVEATKSNVDLDKEAGPNIQLMIKKIERRLADILKYWGVCEIIIKTNQIETGKVRILEARKAPEETPTAAVEVCRKGYQRGDRTIRPADVIIVEKNDN